MSEERTDAHDLLALTADIVSAHVANNSVAFGDLPVLIANVHGALTSLRTPPDADAAVELKPAVAIRSSVKPDYIVCLEDGKKLKMLKRHLMTHYALTPAAYREKWNLPTDYPMVAPNYAEQRRVLAKKIGLGKRPSSKRPNGQPQRSPTRGGTRKNKTAR